MSLDSEQLKDLEMAIADRLYIQIASWNLYLGDAKLAKSLAIECMAYFSEGAKRAAGKALDSVEVSLAGGATSLPLSKLIPPAQIFDLEEILESYFI